MKLVAPRRPNTINAISEPYLMTNHLCGGFKALNLKMLSSFPIQEPAVHHLAFPELPSLAVGIFSYAFGLRVLAFFLFPCRGPQS